MPFRLHGAKLLFFNLGTCLKNRNYCTYRTLSKDEHVYLINTRKFDSATGEGKSYQRVTLTGHGKGLLIYPDGFADQKANTTWIEITDIPAGCIFLPAAGYRYGSSVYSVVGSYSAGSGGDYWSSSPLNATNACELLFGDGGVAPLQNSNRCSGRSVRLFSEL